MKLEFFFLTDFRKIVERQISCKSVQLEPNCSVRIDGQTDGKTDRHDEANSRFLFAILRALLKSLHSAHRIYYAVFFVCVSQQTETVGLYSTQ